MSKRVPKCVLKKCQKILSLSSLLVLLFYYYYYLFIIQFQQTFYPRQHLHNTLRAPKYLHVQLILLTLNLEYKMETNNNNNNTHSIRSRSSDIHGINRPIDYKMKNNGKYNEEILQEEKCNSIIERNSNGFVNSQLDLQTFNMKVILG